MTNKSTIVIAFGLNPKGAETAKAHLVNKGYAENNIRTTMNPIDILNLIEGEAELAVIQTHPTDMTVWKRQLPLCNHLQASRIKHVIVKANC